MGSFSGDPLCNVRWTELHCSRSFPTKYTNAPTYHYTGVLDRYTVFTFRVEVYLLTNVVNYIHTLQGKSMGGGKEISLGKGNRAQEIGGGYSCTGVMWKNEEKRQTSDTYAKICG